MLKGFLVVKTKKKNARKKSVSFFLLHFLDFKFFYARVYFERVFWLVDNEVSLCDKVAK